MSETVQGLSETLSTRCDKLDSRNEEIWRFMRALLVKKKVQVTEESAPPSEKGKEAMVEEEEVQVEENEQVQIVEDEQVQVDEVIKEKVQVTEVSIPPSGKGKEPIVENEQIPVANEDENMEE